MSQVAFQRVAPILPVDDVAAALEHYRKLGFTADAYAGDAVNELIYGFLRWGRVELHLARTPGLDPKTNTSACYVYVDDADAVYAQWRTADVAGRLDPPRDTPYGLREMAHIDPDGNLLRIGSPIGGPADEADAR